MAIKIKAIEANVSIDPALKTASRPLSLPARRGKREMAEWRAEADKDYPGKSRHFPRQSRLRVRPELQQVRRSRVMSASYAPITATARAARIRTTGRYVAVGHPREQVRQHPHLLQGNAAERPHNAHAGQRNPKAVVVAAKIARGMSSMDRQRSDVDRRHQAGPPKVGPVSLAPSSEHDKSAGLIVSFSPYAVGSYVEGDYIVFVPWTAFKTHLSQRRRPPVRRHTAEKRRRQEEPFSRTDSDENPPVARRMTCARKN